MHQYVDPNNGQDDREFTPAELNELQLDRAIEAMRGAAENNVRRSLEMVIPVSVLSDGIDVAKCPCYCTRYIDMLGYKTL